MEVEGQSESDQKDLLLRHQQTAVSMSPSLFSVYQTQDLVVIVNPFRNILFSSSSCSYSQSSPSFREKQLEQLAQQIIEKQGIDKAALNNKGMMQFLIPGASITFVDSFPAHLQTWRGHPYHLFSLDLAANTCSHTSTLGAGNLELTDSVILDVLRLEDVDDIQSQQTVAYEEMYLRALVTQEPYCLMNACVRVKEGSEWRLASWCCTHFDLTLGLLATRSEYRQKGYGQRCLLSVISKQQHHSLSKSLAFIKEDNISSLRLFVKSGFRRVDSEPCFWAGIEYPCS